MVYQGSPLGATVIPNGPLPLTALPSVMTPALVMLAALPLVSWVNHTVPLGEAVMPEGPVLVTGNSVTELLDGSRRPAAWGVNRAVNQTCPSAATVMLRGATVVEPSVVGVVVTAPVAAYGCAVLAHAVWNTSTLFGPGNFVTVYLILMAPLFLTVVAMTVWVRRSEGRMLAGALADAARRGLLPATDIAWVVDLSARRRSRAHARDHG